MSEKKASVITPEFRLSFPSVFEPSEFSGHTKFRITMMFPKKETDLKDIKALATLIAEECWGDKNPSLQPYYEDGDKSDYESSHGMWIIKATSHIDRKPKVWGIKGEILTKESGELYAGCWAKAKIVANAYGKGSKGFTGCDPGVSFYFLGIRKTRDDESFEGGSCAADEFGPTDTAGDDIPF